MPKVDGISNNILNRDSIGIKICQLNEKQSKKVNPLKNNKTVQKECYEFKSNKRRQRPNKTHKRETLVLKKGEKR